VAEERACFVGLDLGQAADYTAAAVVERRLPDGASRSAATHALVHLERLPLGTSYPEVVRVAGELMGSLPAGSRLVVDATGVGRPVVDLLARARLSPIPVVVHGGAETTRDANGFIRAPKRELVSTAQVALQQGRLRFVAGLPLAPTLKEELQNFRQKIADNGHDSYEAWREGQHDDLVFALCLAVWRGERFWPRDHRPVPVVFSMQ